MKIFSAAQMKDWDACTMQEQQVTSHELMERAAMAGSHWLINNGYTNRPVKIFCGKGNNGGDGLAIARILLENNIAVTTYIMETGKEGTKDFQVNLHRLHPVTNDIHFIQTESFFPAIDKNTLVIDALFGTGLNKPLSGIALQLVDHINKSNALVVSIDLPSGLFCDKSSLGFTFIHARHTISFQTLKLAFLMAENDAAIGTFHLLDIGLSDHYHESTTTKYEITDPLILKNLLKQRSKFSHKGSFGHAALISGSHGMMGAAVLAAKGCMYSGAGKLTCYIPSGGLTIMQVLLPEAMCRTEGEKNLGNFNLSEKYDAMGIGPGIGMDQDTAALLENIFNTKPQKLVVDADALNRMALDKQLMDCLPKGAVITPHPKEFERLFGVAGNDFERLELAVRKAAELEVYIVLKGHYTAIVTPHGKVYFNNTGNAGMAKAGMGDVLTGIITGLLAQGYDLPEAALLGVYLHGLAGDMAAIKFSQEVMQATDLLNCLTDAWKSIAN